MPSLLNVKTWSVGDVIAGVTVAATSLPQYIAYAELAGLAGHRGLTSSGPPVMAFAFLTGSPSLCIGVTSITALMSHAALNGGEYKEAYGEEKWMDLLGTFSCLVGLVSLVLALSGAAKLTPYIPAAVKSGWKLGFAITVCGAQTAGSVFNSAGTAKKIIPQLFGVTLSGGAAAMFRMGWMLAHPFEWDVGPIGLTLLTLFIVLVCKDMLKKIFRLPGIEVIIACLLGTLIAMNVEYTGEIVGVPPAAPDKKDGGMNVQTLLTSWVRRLPWEMPWGDLFARFGGAHWAVINALAFACVDFLAIISVVPEGPANELAGQGVGCIVSGMVGSAPIGGSLSRSNVAGMTGASSPLMGLVSGIATLILAFPQVGQILAPMPKSVLAAVVLAATLPGVVNPKDVLKLKSVDALVGWITALASCMIDPTMGFGVGLAAFVVLRVVPGSLTKKKDE
jgi:MFS superfamily sulfate permease-like transporter